MNSYWTGDFRNIKELEINRYIWLQGKQKWIHWLSYLLTKKQLAVQLEYNDHTRNWSEPKNQFVANHTNTTIDEQVALSFPTIGAVIVHSLCLLDTTALCLFAFVYKHIHLFWWWFACASSVSGHMKSLFIRKSRL